MLSRTIRDAGVIKRPGIRKDVTIQMTNFGCAVSLTSETFAGDRVVALRRRLTLSRKAATELMMTLDLFLSETEPEAE